MIKTESGIRIKFFFYFFALFVLGVSLFFAQKSYGATLSNASDTITTSRPSAATPLSANAAATDAQISVLNNSSRFLASDSAKIVRTSTGGDVVTGLTVASQSAALTSLYFTAAIGGSGAQAGTDVAVTNITAMHAISFVNPTPIPSGGKIIITFPGTSTNPNNASPSATMFSFNGLSASNIQANFSAGSATCGFAINLSTNTITCTTANANIAANTTTTILIGCSANSGATCSTQVPTLINPTKTAGAGTADLWAVSIQTQDASGINLDYAKVKIGTIESVQVQANVDPTLSFVIAGLSSATSAINEGNATGCTNSESANTGIVSTATTVNLGTLSLAAININAQLLTVATNGINGYSLTATSSGHLINPATGFWIPDNGTSPGTFTAGTPQFGIHPCGSDVSSATWAIGTTGGGAGAKYGWPTQTGMVTLASDATGPILGTTATHGVTSVEYAGTINASIPAGIYTSVITYVATPTF